MKKGAPKRSSKLNKPAGSNKKAVSRPSAKRKTPFRLKKTLSPAESPSFALDPVGPAAASPAPSTIQEVPAHFELPSHYGDNKIVLMVRDPWWIYAYWEVQPDLECRTLDQIAAAGLQRGRTVLRVYDVTRSSIESPRAWFDIEISFLVGNWYIDVGIPDHDWAVELGVRASSGRFFPIVRSNTVKTPRFGVSEAVDEEWLSPDDVYWKLFGLSGGLADRRSSLDVRDILEKYLKSIVSSESMSSFSLLRNESRVDISAKILDRP